MTYTIVILISTTEKWLRLTRQERNEFNENFFLPLIYKYRDFIKVRLFDSESTNAHYTDFIIVETTDLNQYYYFWEEVRDSEIYTVPYFKVNEIIVGKEDGFREFEDTIDQK